MAGAVHWCVCVGWEADMDAMAQLAILTAATVLAAAAAFGISWAFLHGAFRLMQPAARPARQRLELVHGTRAVVRGFALHR
jgi:hypothetical protein